MPEAIPMQADIGAYKGQPWILFDTVAASSFLIGDTSPAGLAIGTNIPAINAAGEMVFFNAPGRTTSNTPWLTNMDVQGQLSYGFEVWAIAIEVKTPLALIGYGTPGQLSVGPATKIVEALLQYSVLDLNLGQEQQSSWPVTAFGNGGGMWAFATTIQNGEPEISCTLKLPEPIAMGRTQNIAAKLKIAPFIFPLLGTPAAPGVGAALAPYVFIPPGDVTPVDLPQSPYGMQIKLIGRRIKQTQYGASPQ